MAKTKKNKEKTTAKKRTPKNNKTGETSKRKKSKAKDIESDDDDFGLRDDDDSFIDEDSDDVVTTVKPPMDSHMNFDPLTFSRIQGMFPGGFPQTEDGSDKQLFESFDTLHNSFGHPQHGMVPMGQIGYFPGFAMHMPHMMHGSPYMSMPSNLPPMTPQGMLSNTASTPSMTPSSIPNDDTSFETKYNVSNTDDKSQRMMLSMSVNLFKMAQTVADSVNTPLNIYSGLSKPSFCPLSDSLFVCGTEEQDPSKRSQNHLIFGQIDNNISLRFIYPVSDHVRDIQWIDNQHIVFAVNQKLGLVRLSNNDRTVTELVMFPEFHKDTIREICISEGNKNLVISGGFDGNVFVTDITRLVSDIQKNEKKSENSLYPCREVVGSVHWHPYETYLASCTTDSGVLHIFDIRTDKKRPAIIYDTGKRELYSHSYKDANTMLLGYGDSSVQIFDMRSKRSTMSFNDPHLKAIGEIKFDYQTKNFAMFGIPAFSLWQFDDSNLNCIANHQMTDSNTISSFDNMYKTSGDFRKGSNSLLVTDSCGVISLYEFT